jgi:hypothetical protein
MAFSLKAYFPAVLVGAAMLFIGCVGTEKPVGPIASAGTAASCDECHSYPGSNLCRTDSVIIAGNSYTQCYACHWGSTVLDSSYDTASKASVFHDVMFQGSGRNFPKTNSHHTDGKVNLNYAQCASCHSYPPASGAHKSHVVNKGKQCYECHFATALADTQYDLSAGAMYFSPRMQAVPGGDERPLLNTLHHLDNSVEISFRKRYQLPAVSEKSFQYNRFGKSCSNIECHRGVSNGGASVERTLWKDTLL